MGNPPYLSGNSVLEIQQQLRKIYKQIVTVVNSETPVASIAELSTVPDTLIPNGSSRYVTTVKDDFVLDKTSSETVDGITVLATSSGTGRWVRRGNPSETWINQTQWYVGPGGNDEADGTTLANRLATWAELKRRVGYPHPVSQDINVVITGNLPESDNVVIDAISRGGQLTIEGSPTTVLDSTVANYLFDPTVGNNQEPQLAIDGFDAAGNVGLLIRFSDAFGPGVDAYAWVQEDLGNGVGGLFRITRPMNPYPYAWPFLHTPVATDSVEVLSLPQIYISHIDAGFDVDFNGEMTLIVDKLYVVDQSTGGGVSMNGGGYYSPSIVNCHLTTVDMNGTSVLEGCFVEGAVYDQSFSDNCYGGYYETYLKVNGAKYFWAVNFGGYIDCTHASYGFYEDTGFFLTQLYLFDSSLAYHGSDYLYGEFDLIEIWPDAKFQLRENRVAATMPANVTINNRTFAYDDIPYLTSGEGYGISPPWETYQVGLPYIVTVFGTITTAADPRFILTDGSEQSNAAGNALPELSVVVPKTGVLRNLKVYVDQDPTVTIVFTIFRVANGDTTSSATAITCSITSGNVFNEDITHTLNVVAGDRLVLQHNQGVGGAATKVSAVFEIG